MTLLILALAAVLGFLVWRKKGPSRFVADVRAAGVQGAQLLPRVVMILVLAGFLVTMLPPGLIASLLGPATGWRGVLYAMALGVFIPGGASITFSIIVVLAEAGTGPVQLVTLLTSWSVFALHRVFIYEIPLMGLQFAATRLLVSLPLPLVAAGMSAAVLWLLGH